MVFLGELAALRKLRRPATRKVFAPQRLPWWRRGRDSNPRYGFRPYTRLAGERLRPLGHLSATHLIDGGPTDQGRRLFRFRPRFDLTGDRPGKVGSVEGTAWARAGSTGAKANSWRLFRTALGDITAVLASASRKPLVTIVISAQFGGVVYLQQAKSKRAELGKTGAIGVARAKL